MKKKSKKKQIVAMTLGPFGAQQLGWHVRCRCSYPTPPPPGLLMAPACR